MRVVLLRTDPVEHTQSEVRTFGRLGEEQLGEVALDVGRSAQVFQVRPD